MLSNSISHQDYYSQLLKSYSDSAANLLKKEQTLSETMGFGDLVEMEDYLRARTLWQRASNAYYNFLAEFKNR